MKDELVDIVMNIHQFNQDLTSLNIKYAETIEEQKQEIERLNKELAFERQIKKEVREYIEKNKQYAELEDYGKNGEYYIDETGLLEILDKGSDKE